MNRASLRLSFTLFGAGAMESLSKTESLMPISGENIWTDEYLAESEAGGEIEFHASSE